jgi:tetratricopeptide (TPR) repeat protein
MSSPSSHDRRERIRTLLRELEDRKVVRSVTVFGAIAFAAIAAAPDIIVFLQLPPWAFYVLLVLVAIGFPAVGFASWNFDILVQSVSGADDTPEEEAEEEPAGGPVGSQAVSVEKPGKSVLRRLAVPAVVLTSVGILAIMIVLPGRDDERVRVLVWSNPVSAQGGVGALDVQRLVYQPLEWLVGAEVVFGPSQPLGSVSAALGEARSQRAHYLLTTDVSVLDDAPMLSVSLHHVASGEGVLQSTGGRGAESLEDAMGRMSLQVAQVVAEGEDIRLPVRPEVIGATSSPVALASFLEGKGFFAAANFDAAAAALRRAIDADSSFLPAYYRLAVVERWRWNHEGGLDAINTALLRPGLPPRWRAILEAQSAYLMRDVDRAITGYEEVTLHYVELVDGWLGLGEGLFHFGGFGGYEPSDALSALNRALQADSVIAPLRHHLAELAMISGDFERAQRLVDGMAGAHPVRPVLELALQLRRASPQEVPSLLAGLQEVELRTASLLVAHFAFDPEGRPMVRDIAAQLLAPDRSPEDRLRGAQYRLVAASTGSEWDEALAEWRQLRSSADFDPWIVHLHQAGRDLPEAEAMLAWADQQLSDGRIPDFDLPLNHDLRRTFKALVHEAVLGVDAAPIRRLLDAIEAAPPPHVSDPGAEVASAALRARLALIDGDTISAIDELVVATSRTFEPFVAFYPLSTMAPERLLLVRLAQAVGRPALAERWSQSFYTSMSFGDLIYQAWVAEIGASAPARAQASPQGGLP